MKTFITLGFCILFCQGVKAQTIPTPIPTPVYDTFKCEAECAVIESDGSTLSFAGTRREYATGTKDQVFELLKESCGPSGILLDRRLVRIQTRVVQGGSGSSTTITINRHGGRTIQYDTWKDPDQIINYAIFARQESDANSACTPSLGPVQHYSTEIIGG